MKKGILISFLVLSFIVPISAAGGFSVSFTGNYLTPADEGYKDVYGSGKFFPELKLGYKVFNGIYLWTGFGLLSATGETLELKLEAKSNQNFMSFGVGYNKDFSPKFGSKIEVGAVYISYKEESMETEVTGSAFGFRIDAGFVYNITRTFFTEVVGGYISAGDKVEEYDADLKLGGFKAGVGIGVRF